VSAEAHFQHLTRQVCNLVGCGSVYLLLGCPELELRHPLLNLFSLAGYCPVACFGPAGHIDLLRHERVRALCDAAIQSGQLQSIDRFQMYASGSHLGAGSEVQSIAVAPLERPSGILGLLLLADSHPGVFYVGERLLLRHYLPRLARNLERDLREMSIVTFHSSFSCKHERTPQQPGSAARRTLEQASQDARELIPAHQQLKELDRLKNEFISMVSHELRTPLTAIKGYAVLLQAYGVTGRPPESAIEEMSPARQREYLDMIMEQTSHLEVLISDLLDISRIHAGRLSLRCSQVDVASLCRRVVQLVQQRADQQYPGRYKISYKLPPDLPLTWVDSDRLQQVLNNLLENAVKYSPDGGPIEVIASACLTTLQPFAFPLEAPCDASSYSETLMVYVTVRDRGIGIAHDQQIHLFKPFSRLEHSIAHDVPGAGLGLYITRKLVEAMGGSIIFSSSEGEGTSVTFTLPVKPPENAPLTDSVPMTALTTR
jgi:signal transduction histidine kinase